LSFSTIGALLIRSSGADNVQVISIEPQHFAALEAVVSQLHHDYIQVNRMICDSSINLIFGSLEAAADGQYVFDRKLHLGGILLANLT